MQKKTPKVLLHSLSSDGEVLFEIDSRVYSTFLDTALHSRLRYCAGVHPVAAISVLKKGGEWVRREEFEKTKEGKEVRKDEPNATTEG